MKVKELIETLTYCDPEAEVFVEYYGYDEEQYKHLITEVYQICKMNNKIIKPTVILNG